MALAATTDAGQALLPRAVAARGKPGGVVLLRTRDLAVPEIPTLTAGTDDVVQQSGREARSRSHLSARLLELPTAAVSLPSRSGSNPDLLDSAGHTPAAFVRVPSGLHAGVFRPGSTRGIPRRTAIPLVVQSC